MRDVNMRKTGVKQSSDDQHKDNELRSRSDNSCFSVVTKAPVHPLMGSSSAFASANRPPLDGRKSQQSQQSEPGLICTLFSMVTKMIGGVSSDTLHGCIEKHNIEGVRNLLGGDIDLDAEDSKGKIPLGYAVYEEHPYVKDRAFSSRGFPDMVRLLLDAGADADRRFAFQDDFCCRTQFLTSFEILEWRSPENGVEIAKLLLDAKDKKSGASWITRKRCSTYLFNVINGYCKYSYDLIDLLLKKGADPNFISSRLKRPVLCTAILRYKLGAVIRLLECGANPKTSWGVNSKDCPLGLAKYELDRVQIEQPVIEKSINLCEEIRGKLQLALTVGSDYYSYAEGIKSDWCKLHRSAHLPEFNYYWQRKTIREQELKDTVRIDGMISALDRGIRSQKAGMKEAQYTIQKLSDIVDLIESAISRLS